MLVIIVVSLLWTMRHEQLEIAQYLVAQGVDTHLDASAILGKLDGLVKRVPISKTLEKRQVK